MGEASCVFCDKLARLDALGDEVVWRFPHSVALLGPWQYYHGYCVLASRSHAEELSGLPDDVRRAQLDEMCLLARAIESAVRPLKMNYELLGNQVRHIHWHLFPRSEDDPQRLAPVWLALTGAEKEEAEKLRLQTGPVPRVDTRSMVREALARLGAVEA